MSTGRYHWPETDWHELHRQRWERIGAMMSEAGLGALVLIGPDHIRYATDFRAHLTNESEWFVAVVDREGQAEMFLPYIDEVIDSPFTDKPWIARTHPLPSWSPATGNPRTWVRDVSAVVRATAASGRIGIDAVDLHLVEGLRAECPEHEFVSASAALHRLRRVKLDQEITLLEASSRVNAAAMEAALAAARPGASDHDLLATAMAFQQSAGVEFVTHSVCNLRNGSGDWFAAGRVLVEGDPFFFDIGCYGVGGYASDAARSGFVGEPHPEHARAFALLQDAHRLVQSLAKPDVRASVLLTECNAFLEGHGLKGTPYGIGHGVGLRLGELPTLFIAPWMDEDARLREGEVIALEPEVSVDVGGRTTVLKVEDNFVVTATGLRRLTEVPEAAEFA